MAKKCLKCARELPDSDFYSSKKSLDRLSARCKKCLSEDGKQYYKDHKEEKIEAWKERREELRDEILALLGGVCCRCGFADPRALCVDHKRGDGYRDRRASGSRYLGTSLYYRVRENPEPYQLLCANCNMIKAKENKEFVGPINGNRRWFLENQ